MSLRNKLMTGWLGMLAIVVGIGLIATRQLADLGEAIDVILSENYRSVVACQDLKEGMERIDSGLLFVLMSEPTRGEALIAANEGEVTDALAVASANVTLPGEQKLVDDLSHRLAGMQADLATISNPETPLATRREIYFSVWLPRFEAMKRDADSVLHMNQQRMHDAAEEAGRRAATASIVQHVSIGAGLVLTVIFGVFLRRWVLDPLEHLTDSTNAIIHGNLDQIIEVTSSDEVGRLAAAFNHMTAYLREMRRMENQRLARSESVRAEMFGALPLAVAVIGPDGTIEASTEEAARTFGLRQETRLQDNRHAWLASLVQPSLAAVLRAGSQPAFIQHFVDGEECYARPILHAIRTSDDDLSGAILVLHDVTQLREQQELKRNAVATVSHQLKTPLTSIRMSLHLLLDDSLGSLNGQQLELATAARDECERLSRTVDDLLDINRIESGRARLAGTPSQPQALVADAVRPLAPDFAKAEVACVEDVPADLPLVPADRPRLSHVFLNLLQNARRYTAAGGRVTVSARQVDGAVRFAVSDTGTGIPAEYHAHLFEPFYQVGESTHEGVGLGLAIVRQIVEAHGGEVGVESDGRTGTTVWFSLPIAADERIGLAP